MKFAVVRPVLVGAMLLCMASFSGRGHSHPAQSKSGNSPAVSSASSNDPWWKHAVIYEVYLRSFQDSNGDGIGDLNFRRLLSTSVR